ncbi:hypothetical protein CRYO30217_01784 [Parvicella tangerina]|uniref:DUF7793 domain-containing protein n=2 Tax=Parvicella tangerina TaxID=2829795 RepID=A0A916JML7_9FLAO|nr:hypothetical protein CRYO30217_01784 [Parvicella tangerina]
MGSEAVIKTVIWEDIIKIHVYPDHIFVLSSANAELVEDHTFEFEELKRLHAFMMELSEGHPLRLVTDTRDVYVKVSTTALKQIAKDDDMNATKIAEALVTTSLPNRLWINFYLNIARPKVPAKAFSNLEKAFEWLRSKNGIKDLSTSRTGTHM